MSWVQPKTNWVDGEYFNVDPDYNRIKGNIEHLIALSQQVYPAYETADMQTATVATVPKVSFFNNVVDNTQAILEHGYQPNGSQDMVRYEQNQRVWNAHELNIIENNHLLLYNCFNSIIAGIKHIEFTLGGVNFER